MISLNTLQVCTLLFLFAYLGWQCWKQGIRTGAERAVEQLHRMKIIAFDNRGNVKPNPFWQEDQKTRN